MAILEHPDAQALLEDATLTVEQLEELAGRIQPFLGRYLPCFQRTEQRENARTILQGKLSSLSRKTCEPIAHFFGARREVLQDFVGSSPWEDRLVLDCLRDHVVEIWAEPAGVLIGDGSGFPKKGDHSCGVKRQYCGRLGKVDNCQIGIFLGYACRRGQVLLDHRLFLPKEWAEDAKRRKKAGVPKEVVYQETWEILHGQIKAHKHVPHAWVVTDAEFGRVNAFRAALREDGERYVVDVRSDLRIRDLRQAPPERNGSTGRFPVVPQTTAERWAATKEATAWEQFKIRPGEKRPLRVEATQTQVLTFEDNRVGPEERLVVIRTVDNPEAKTWYCLSNAAEEVPLREVVRGHGQRFWEEANFKEGKSEVGLDEYEVRGWRGWHHHMTLSLLALWFLASERDVVKKKRQR